MQPTGARPPPTAAAEMALPVRLDLLSDTAQFGGRLSQAMARYLDEGRIYLEGLVRGIPRLDMIVEQKAQELDGLSERLKRGPELLIQRRREDLGALGARLNLDRFRRDLDQSRKVTATFGERLSQAARRAFADAENRVSTLGARLESVSPRRVLERGYALVRDAKGVPMTAAKGVATGSALSVEFSDNSVDVTVTGGGAAPKPRRSSKRGDTPNQGTLL